MQLPIAEYFESIQGEGLFAGTHMLFVRLAGCNVGVYTAPLSSLVQLAAVQPELTSPPAEVPYRHSLCTDAAGHTFVCDTDYRLRARVELLTLLQTTKAVNVCVTGGEPFLHGMLAIVRFLRERGYHPHIETSGTLPIPEGMRDYKPWITCSPKKGFLLGNRPFISEYKFVVPPTATADEMVCLIETTIGCPAGEAGLPIYLQPVGGITEPGRETGTIMAAMRLRPGAFRLSVQVHKFLALR